MFHLSAYFQVDTVALTLGDVPAVTDGWATVQNNHFIYQQDYKLVHAWAFANTITRARISAPHYRFVNTPEIVPVSTVQADVQGLTTPLWQPPFIKIPRIDEIQFLATTSGTSTTGVLGATWIHDGQFNVTQGDIYPVRFTASITGATGSWQRGNIAFTESLPAGRYDVLGLDLVGTGFLLGRLRFQNYVMLPGVIVRPDLNDTIRDVFRNGRMGSFGQFENTAQPTLELFSNVASGTAVTGVMDLVRIGGAPQ